MDQSFQSSRLLPQIFSNSLDFLIGQGVLECAGIQYSFLRGFCCTCVSSLVLCTSAANSYSRSSKFSSLNLALRSEAKEEEERRMAEALSAGSLDGSVSGLRTKA